MDGVGVDAGAVAGPFAAGDEPHAATATTNNRPNALTATGDLIIVLPKGSTP